MTPSRDLAAPGCSGSGFGIQGSGGRVQRLACRAAGLGCRVVVDGRLMTPSRILSMGLGCRV